jgi:hypothetical protein
MLQEKLAPGVTGEPLQVSEDNPDKASDRVPVAGMLDVVKTAPSVGELTARAGGVLSMLRVTLAVALFWALSVTVPLTT